MKTLKIPFIEGLEKKSFEDLMLAMETGAVKAYIDTIDWKEDWPYAPDTAFSVARSKTHLVILYRVRGLDLRAQALEDNGPVWEDSCCEFFIAHPDAQSYYNFEMNCIGTLVATRRKSREEFTPFTPEQLDRIIRHTSLERKAYDLNGQIFSWQTAICIPFDLMGMDPEQLPEEARANFYKCADKAAHPHFVSWNPIEIEQPDFHRPDFFGKLLF